MSMDRVHPRVCGEAQGAVSSIFRDLGPSPRVRGSRVSRVGQLPADGSIPACAGKPAAFADAPPPSRVHPRVCGEASFMTPWNHLVKGPSPRVRGSLEQKVGGRVRSGSIPACAGKPQTNLFALDMGGVHPRVCGEAVRGHAQGAGGRGPSPRVRGSLVYHPLQPHRHGSIPACAGKPRSTSRTCRSMRVHPRVCGEATRRAPLKCLQ